MSGNARINMARLCQDINNDEKKKFYNWIDNRKVWADIPAPKRGEIVRQIGEALRQNLVPVTAKLPKKSL